MVEESRITGEIFEDINATYIFLIHNTSKTITLLDYRAISLCNLVYKIITKVISNRIKHLLLEKIFVNQFGFLNGRQIHDAIGIAYEALHSIKIKKLNAMILKWI